MPSTSSSGPSQSLAPHGRETGERAGRYHAWPEQPARDVGLPSGTPENLREDVRKALLRIPTIGPKSADRLLETFERWENVPDLFVWIHGTGLSRGVRT
jgi:hypothetical protein